MDRAKSRPSATRTWQSSGQGWHSFASLDLALSVPDPVESVYLNRISYLSIQIILAILPVTPSRR